MTRPTKKAQERRLIEAMLPELGLSSATIKDGENPDFIVELLEYGTVGIELTCYTAPGDRRRTEATWDGLLEQVRADLPSYPWMEGVSVSLWFEPLKLPHPRQWAAFITEITTFLKPMVPGLARRKTRDISIPECGFPIMRKHLKFIDAGRPGIYVDWYWNGNVGWIGVTDTELCDIINKKGGLKYLGAFDALWLIVHGGWSVSQFLEPIDADQLRSFAELAKLLASSPFQRVYLLGSLGYCWTAEAGWHVVARRPSRDPPQLPSGSLVPR
jgi:hypothetical protein